MIFDNIQYHSVLFLDISIDCYHSWQVFARSPVLLIQIARYLRIICHWLVVWTWKIWVRQLGWLEINPILMGKCQIHGNQSPSSTMISPIPPWVLMVHQVQVPGGSSAPGPLRRPGFGEATSAPRQRPGMPTPTAAGDGRPWETHPQETPLKTEKCGCSMIFTGKNKDMCGKMMKDRI